MAELNSSAHVQEAYSSSDPSSHLALCKRAVASYMRSYSINDNYGTQTYGGECIKKQVRG